MIIDLASVGKNPKAIELEFDPADIELDEGTRPVGPIRFSGDIKRDDVRTQVRGHISGAVETDCVRCLEPVSKKIEIDFDDVFVDAESLPDAEEVQVGPEDLDVAILTEPKLDLADIVREQLILETSEPVFCKDDCQGLCPKCGANRNLIDCKCEENEIDPRWAALKNLN